MVGHEPETGTNEMRHARWLDMSVKQASAKCDMPDGWTYERNMETSEIRHALTMVGHERETGTNEMRHAR